MKKLAVNQPFILFKKIVFEVVNFSGFIDFFNEAILKTSILVESASVEHNAILQANVFIYYAIFTYY